MIFSVSAIPFPEIGLKFFFPGLFFWLRTNLSSNLSLSFPPAVARHHSRKIFLPKELEGDRKALESYPLFSLR